MWHRSLLQCRFGGAVRLKLLLNRIEVVCRDRNETPLTAANELTHRLGCGSGGSCTRAGCQPKEDGKTFNQQMRSCVGAGLTKKISRTAAKPAKEGTSVGQRGDCDCVLRELSVLCATLLTPDTKLSDPQ